MKTSILSNEQLAEYGLNGKNCEFNRRITMVGIDSMFEKMNYLDGSEEANGTIIMYCVHVIHMFVPIGKGKYEWWKCY